MSISERLTCGASWLSVLPVEVEDFHCLVAAVELVVELGSAEWPVSCAGTGVGSARTQVGCLLVTNKCNHECGDV